MWWVSNLVDMPDDNHAVGDPDRTFLLVSYLHINPLNKEIEVHTKVCKDEDEFITHYLKVKCL